MNRLKKRVFMLSVGFVLAFIVNVNAAQANYKVIPLPAKIEKAKGAFTLTDKTKIIYPAGDKKMERNAQFLSDYLYEITGNRLTITTKVSKENAIILETGLKNKNPEAYTLYVSSKVIKIKSLSSTGVFYGIQTLRKATPIEISKKVVYPAVSISDEPRFAYRGMHLDVGRNFKTADFVKKYIDILALHNVNKFHWHLTEDQGWRIEIKKYPKLTEIGAWRTETVLGHNTGIFDGKPHGGFYTQDEIRDIVRYAADRHITIIPEIDLPGHMLAALASNPELGCTGGPYEVEKTWGVFDDVLCVGKESTFTFLENVFTEVMDLFPSEYIHIGGDECPKVRWEECPLCQAKIKELGLKDDSKHKKEFYLQSYVIERVEKFLNEKGRKIIGWDEILEGKLAPNATVMSWRGMEGGIEAAQMGHDVIMTPSSHLYFDHYQTTDKQNEPVAIGGFTPVSHVYSFDPIPAKLTVEQRKHILGVQANLWNEYIQSSKQAEYMLLPRLAALCEVQWMQAENRNYLDFLKRLPTLIAFYDKYNYTYATHVFEVQAIVRPNSVTKSLDVEFATIDDAPVYYTLDGTTPNEKSNLYKGKFSIKESAEIRAVAFLKNGKTTPVYSESFTMSKSTFMPITLLNHSAASYTYTGAVLLNDGLRGRDTNFKTGRWIGFENNDLVAVIDLQNQTEISKVSIQTCIETGEWILDAQELKVEVSDDGINYRFVAGIETDPNLRNTHWKDVMNHTVKFPVSKTQYVKVTVSPFKKFPTWHGAPDGKAFVFVDEILIE